MKELLKINFENDRPTVSARELHKALEIKTQFKDWFPRMCEYGFTDGEDFCSFLSESTGGRPAQDAQLTIDMAKEICMLQRNEKGKITRAYFIQLEKDWNSPEKIMARALQIADQKIKMLQAENEEMKPKALFADCVTASETSILVRDFAKILRQSGVQTGEKRLYNWFRENGYVIKGTCQPTQKSMEQGLFEVIERTISRGGKPPITTMTTKITGKGQIFFINKLVNESLVGTDEKALQRKEYKIALNG